jgi:glyoxylase I family protein
MRPVVKVSVIAMFRGVNDREYHDQYQKDDPYPAPARHFVILMRTAVLLRKLNRAWTMFRLRRKAASCTLRTDIERLGGHRMPEFPTITHVALTVTDLDRSVPWYEQLFDAKPVVDEDTGPFRHVVWLVGGQTLVGLHQFPDLADGSEFNERRIGLDHLAFQCADRGELEQWTTRLDELGIPHGGIVDAGYGSGLSFRDPDNIALEFFSPPS